MSTAVQEALIALFNQAPIKKSLGLILEFNVQGEAVCRMPRNGQFDHGGHDTHGGIVATVLDNAGWFTVAAACQEAVVTSDLHVRLLQAINHRDLMATAQVVRMGSKLAVAEMKAFCGDDLVAIATAGFTKIGPLPKR